MKWIIAVLFLMGCTDNSKRSTWEGVDVDTLADEDTDTQHDYDNNLLKVQGSTPCYVGRFDMEEVEWHIDALIRGEEYDDLNEDCREVAAEFAYQLTELGVCPLEDMDLVCVDYPSEYWGVDLSEEYNAVMATECRQLIQDNYGCI